MHHGVSEKIVNTQGTMKFKFKCASCVVG